MVAKSTTDVSSGRPASIDILIANNYPAFGFEQGDSQQISQLILRRSGLDDHLNFDIVKGAYLGTQHIEVPEHFGTPVSLLQLMDTPDVLSFFYSVNALKGNNWELGGLPFGKLIAKLVHFGYGVGRVEGAPNTIRGAKNRRLGFALHNAVNPLTMEERANSLSTEEQTHLLRAFFSPRWPTQERQPHNPGNIYDPVYALYHRTNGQAIDSTISRQKYLAKFVQQLRSKYELGDQFNTDRFQGWIIKSLSNSDRVYFLQRNVFGMPGTRLLERYDCTCYKGYQRTYGRNLMDECKHVENLKKGLEMGLDRPSNIRTLGSMTGRQS